MTERPGRRRSKPSSAPTGRRRHVGALRWRQTWPTCRRSPKDPFAWFNLGTDYVALGDFEAAAQGLRHGRGGSKLPWRMLWYQFGPFQAYYEVGRHEEVIALADATIKTARNDRRALLSGRAWRRRRWVTRSGARQAVIGSKAVKLRPTYQASG